jgi:hypothetical protein
VLDYYSKSKSNCKEVPPIFSKKEGGCGSYSTASLFFLYSISELSPE